MQQRAAISSLAPEAAQSKLVSGGSTGKGKEKEKEQSAGTLAKEETALSKVVKDSKKITVECQHGMMCVGPLSLSV